MSRPPRILWLKTGPLHPLDTGGKLRTYHMLRELAKTHLITYLSLCPSNTEDEAMAAAAEYSQAQIWIPWASATRGSFRFLLELAGNLFSPLPYVIQKYRSAAMARALREADTSGQFDLVVCDFLTPAVNLFPGANTHTRLPSLLFEHNVESQIWQRLAANASDPIRRVYFRQQWRRLWRFEGQAAARFDAVVGVSDEDCAQLKKEFGLTNVLGSVPTGVDATFFESVGKPRQAGTIAFVGSMDYMPNQDAVAWFVRDILPPIERQIPRATFTVIGRNPPQRIRELAAQNPAVRVTGTVPDVRPYLAEAECAVVPLRVGGGTRIKIYEAMAAGIPVVSTRIGAEGLQVTHNENILLADSPEEFARQTIELLRQPSLRERLAASARKMVAEQFGWESVTRKFAAYCQRTAELRKAGTGKP